MQIDTNKLNSFKNEGAYEWVLYWSALHYASNGIYIVPLMKDSKKLPPKSYGVSYINASVNKKTIEEWFMPGTGKFEGWNIGIATGKEGGVFAIDVDRHGTQDGFIELDRILKEVEEEIEAPCQTTPGGGEHFLFQWQENATSSTSKIASGIDTRGGTDKACKGHIVAYPSSVNGKQYKWKEGGDVPFIPKWALERLGVVWKPKKYSQRGNENIVYDDLEKEVPVEQINRMLMAIDPNTLTYDEWLKVGQAINTQFATDVGMDMWDKWSATGDRYQVGECQTRWRGFDPTGPVRIGSLFYYSKISGWEPQEDDVSVSKNATIIERLNAQFAVIVVGGKIKILREKDHVTDPVLGHYDLLDKESFRVLLQNDVTEYAGPDGKIKRVSVADLWLGNDIRRTFPNGMRLMPDKKGHHEGYYNTWNGFSVDPREGDCSLLINHIQEVICNGDESLFTWVMDWCADSVQDPANPKGACIVMRGEEGTGKGTLANTMGELFGSHYRHLIDDSHLLSNFNAHMMDSVFVFADEITWGGNMKTAGKLKGMVTEEWLVGERKGVDAVGYRNMIHLMIASNSAWVIPAGTNSRRWCVMEVSNERVGDVQYFTDVFHQLECGGKEAFLKLLLDRKITSNLRKAPDTEALKDQRMRSIRFDSTLNWWTTTLIKGVLETVDLKDHDMSWPAVVSKVDIYDEYKRYCDDANLSVEHISTFGKEVKKFGWAEARPNVNNNRIRGYKIPDLEECIEIAEKRFGISIDDEEK